MEPSIAPDLTTAARAAAPAPTPAQSHAPRLGLASQPVYAHLAQFPAVCFIGALLADVVYWQSANFIWATFSVWLLAIGSLGGGLAALAGVVTWISHPHVRTRRFARAHAAASCAAWLLAVANTFVHSRDGYTAVVPDGIALSVVAVILMLLATWLGWPRTPLPGVAPHPNQQGAR